MKKNIFKKTLVAFTAALMMAATTIPASAADYTITIDNDCPDHTYQAYQIFAGTLDGDTLSNITWGTGITEDGKTALGDAAAKAATLADTDAAKAFAKLVAPYLSTTYVEDDYDDDSYALTVSDAGYYLIIDKPESLNNTDESYTSYILEVVKDVTTSPKSEVPTVEKKVQDKNDTANTTSDWQDSADYDIGDTVPFEITVTLPNNYEDYTNYSLVITDTLSDGLDFTDNSVKVFIGNTELYPGYYCNDGVLTIDLTSALANATADVNSSEIKITYTATLNENAVIGGAGNPNTVSATYSNNPNSDMDGSTDDTGTTPEDKVVVFTYNVIIDKVDENSNALTGAEFKLEKNVDGNWTEITRLTVDQAGDTFTFSGLDDGDYKLSETTTPGGYNTINPVVFTISATHDATADNPTITELTSTLDGAVADKDAGTIAGEIMNQKGSSLPSTGGIGRTIFFVSGGILVAVAGIILIIKKRMNNAD